MNNRNEKNVVGLNIQNEKKNIRKNKKRQNNVTGKEACSMLYGMTKMRNMTVTSVTRIVRRM